MNGNEESYRETDSDDAMYMGPKGSVKYNPDLDAADLEPENADPVEQEWQRIEDRFMGTDKTRAPRCLQGSSKWWLLLAVALLALIIYWRLC